MPCTILCLRFASAFFLAEKTHNSIKRFRNLAEFFIQISSHNLLFSYKVKVVHRPFCIWTIWLSSTTMCQTTIFFCKFGLFSLCIFSGGKRSCKYIPILKPNAFISPKLLSFFQICCNAYSTSHFFTSCFFTNRQIYGKISCRNFSQIRLRRTSLNPRSYTQYSRRFRATIH